MNNPSNFQISRAKELCGKLLPFAGLALREGYLDLGVQKNPVAGTGEPTSECVVCGGPQYQALYVHSQSLYLPCWNFSNKKSSVFEILIDIMNYATVAELRYIRRGERESPTSIFS